MTGKNGSAPDVTEAPTPLAAESCTTEGDYTTLAGLEDRHIEALRASGISPDVIKDRGYRTITDPGELSSLGFSPAQARQVPGLLLPLHSVDDEIPLYVYRPDIPRVYEDKRSKPRPDGTYPNKIIKYELPKGERVRLDCPPCCRSDLGNPQKPLWITEGQKKADSLASHNLVAIALLGVWNFKGRNEQGGSVFLADWDYIALRGREIRIVFDSDVMTKPEVHKALNRLTEHLQRKGAIVGAAYLPGGPKGKLGVDDWLAEGHTVEELTALVEAPRPTPQAAPPRVELLDDSPLVIRRPLALIGGKAYAAVWPYIKMSILEKIGSDGKIYRLSQAEEKIERQLHIVRGDGAIFGPYGSPFSQMGLDIKLPEIPQSEKLWSTPGIKAYIGGYRPDPSSVFKRVKGVIDRFMDFDRSLADQETMTDLIACYVLASWLLDAFSVASFLWINGEKGCGKTSLLLAICEVSHLAQALSPSGSFASLRDLADYGATLGLDDAEDISDPNKSDPDKRALLLSGNRRGVTVPLKEIGPNGQWQTRNVNGFCPRLFSAIAKPDLVLSSRTLIIPLARTAERYKGNSDPLDYKQWPCERQELIDDLWAMAVSSLPEMVQYDECVRQNARLVGRDLQPWQSILAVAAWLDKNGIPGLWTKLEELAAVGYQEEREDLEVSDENRLLVRALGEFASRTPDLREWDFATQDIVTIMHRMIDDEEIDLDLRYINARSMGRRLRKMRFKKAEAARPRRWRMKRPALVKQFRAYSLQLPEILCKNESQVPVGDNGRNGRNGRNGAITTVTTVTTVSEDRSDENILHNSINPSPCFACGQNRWKKRSDGILVCEVCHPGA